MRQTTKMIVLLVVLVSAFKGWAQINNGMVGPTTRAINAYANYIFTEDSLAGFDEPAAKIAALNEGYIGEEYKVKMFWNKRLYVNAKYNIQPKHNKVIPANSPIYNSVTPACTNEDFEASAAGNITTQGQINGWTINGGSVGGSFNSCNLPPLTNPPTECVLINCGPTGTIDPVIGGCYPIYSVFGSNTNNGNTVNPSLPQMYGDQIIRINSNVNNYSVAKLSKTFAVTANNALFQFAFISVFSTGHTCCSAGAFQINLTNATANTVIPCPSYSISAPSPACPATNTNVNYFIAGGACPAFTGSGTYIFNKWNFNSLDLSSYIGQNITIDIIASDCDASGHYGYVYFDAQCSPMTIIGNGNGFPAGTPNITLPTCGASGATITAPGGLGPYSWSSSQISIPANLSVPSNTNQTLITNQSGTVQLTMNPPGSCNPIIKVITVTITPAPVAFATATQASCTNTLSAASLTTAGSASVNPTITWNPAPASLGSGSLTATGLPVGITTITVLDNTGCQTQATLNILATPPPVTFAINNPATLTCTSPTITMTASTGYTYGTLSYTWSSASFSATGNPVNISQQGSYNVCGIDPATTCSMCTTFTVTQDFSIPTHTVNPTTQVITCNTVSAATFTNTTISPTINLVTNWYSPLAPYPAGPPASSDNNQSSIFTAGSTGIFTVEVCNLFNGCCNTKTVSVTSISNFPTFQTSSTSNYSVGCNPLHQTTLCIVNAVTNGPAQFIFLPPGTPSAAPLPTTAFGAQSCSTIATPGTWTVLVMDPTNGCQTSLPVPILQNTIAPHVLATFAPIVSQTLTCFNPTLLATGTSSTPGTTISWQVPSTPPVIPASTIIVGPPTGPATHTNNLTYATYTCIASNTVNACQTTSLVFINQNFRIPTPSLAVGNPSVINCNVQPVVLSYTNNAANSGMPGAVGIVTSWMGPSPQSSLATVAQYSAYVAGVYTLTVQDNKNGCYGTKTWTVGDATQPPVIALPIKTSTLPCGGAAGAPGSGAQVQIALSSSLSAWSLYINEYPAGAAFTNNSLTLPAGVNQTGMTSNSYSVDMVGQYEYIVTNKITGCNATGTILVVAGGLTADFLPDVSSGFAPHNVVFTNNSNSSVNSLSITSLWSFGNGASQTTTTNVQTSATYTAPGTYTVMMIAKKGDCLDTAFRVIDVFLPSAVEIPNVFTPNGDGSNDEFFLKVSSVTEINALIFDRWGNRVYEVTSNTGNIAWDGKSLDGKECPAGTYFYIIKAKGKDAKDYDMKGNVSLYR
jgi:gliding motility-associated-like protein